MHISYNVKVECIFHFDEPKSNYAWSDGAHRFAYVKNSELQYALQELILELGKKEDLNLFLYEICIDEVWLAI